MSGCFGNWTAALPKLNRAAATSCGFSAKQSDKATSSTSREKERKRESFFISVMELQNRVNQNSNSIPKTFFCKAGDIRPLEPSVSKNAVSRCRAI